MAAYRMTAKCVYEVAAYTQASHQAERLVRHESRVFRNLDLSAAESKLVTDDGREMVVEVACKWIPITATRGGPAAEPAGKARLQDNKLDFATAAEAFDSASRYRERYYRRI